MADWQSGEVTVNGLTLHYTRTGGDKAQVVLAHGFSDDGLCWTPVAELLAADYDVIMVDARGHGRSDGPEQGYGSAEHAADLAGLIEALRLERPAVLGHSMGAAAAQVLAGSCPDLPRAILLEDPPPRWMPPDPAEGGPRRAHGDWIIELKRKTREELMAHQRAESPSWSEAELGPWADAKLRLSFHVLNRAESLPLDWPATVKQITCPVLLITADPEQGAIVPVESAGALKEMLPQTQVVNLPGAGHNIRREQFERYMEVIKRFLAETAA
jgi:pimeloyl-ACP methyl ester carboxylesterase